MVGHVIIDGNNLLHAMHAHAPLPNVGRETMVRIIERWAGQSDDRVTLVFDGAAPGGDLARQMASRRIRVIFAAPQSADDVIVAKVHQSRLPDRVRVVTDDTAIGYEARARHCEHVGCVGFIRDLLAPMSGDDGLASGANDELPGDEKPETVSPDEVEHWVEFFEEEEGPIDDREFR